MIGALRAVYALDVFRFIEGEDVIDLQGAYDFFAAIGQRCGFADFQGRCQSTIDRKRDRDRPCVCLAAAANDFAIQDFSKCGPIHRSCERTQSAVTHPVEARKVCLTDRDALEFGCLAAKIGSLAFGNGAVDGFLQASMWRDQVWHQSISSRFSLVDVNKPASGRERFPTGSLAFPLYLVSGGA